MRVLPAFDPQWGVGPVRHSLKRKPLSRRAAALAVVVMTALIARVAPAQGESHERGDVPGWVMVTLMSAALVALLLAIAAPALEGLFNQAIKMVTQKG